MDSGEKRILVIDDNDAIRIVLVDALEDEGYEVDDAENGLAAINLVKEKEYELVVTDIIMPDEDGLGAIMKIKKLQPHIKIIAISGGGRINSETYLDMAKQLGANCSFKKPFDINEILDKVSELLEN
jgi:DNA-binding NtrC family response regulator